MVADRRSVEGNEITTTSKITFLPLGIVVAGAGVGEMADKFNERIPFILEDRKRLNFEEIKKSQPDAAIEVVPYYFKPYEFLDDCEGLIFNLHERYNQPLQTLVATGNSRVAELNYIDSEHIIASKRRSYICIGCGSPYANFMLKKVWHSTFTMVEAAKLGAFIINLVSDMEIDTFVGNGIQIVIIPDVPDGFQDMTPEEQQKYVPQEAKLAKFDEKKLRDEFYVALKDIQKKIQS